MEELQKIIAYASVIMDSYNVLVDLIIKHHKNSSQYNDVLNDLFTYIDSENAFL